MLMRGRIADPLEAPCSEVERADLAAPPGVGSPVTAKSETWLAGLGLLWRERLAAKWRLGNVPTSEFSL